AAYARGSALNVVVGIDQVGELMRTLKRAPRALDADAMPLGSAQRAALSGGLAKLGELYFPFGSLTALVRARAGDGALVFEVFPREFPLRSRPLVALEDLAAKDAFGQGGPVWFGGSRGFKTYARADLDADGQAQTARLLDALRRDALGALALAQAASDAERSREQFERTARLTAEVNRRAAARRELAQTSSELADRLAPQAGDVPRSLVELLSPPAPPFPAPIMGAP